MSSENCRRALGGKVSFRKTNRQEQSSHRQYGKAGDHDVVTDLFDFTSAFP